MTALNRNRLLLLLLIIGAAAFWLTRPSPPTPRSVDGVYVSACCDPVRLENGVLIAGAQRVPFRLVMMKFGLVAYPARAVSVRDGHVIVLRATADAPAITFDTHQQGFTLLSSSGSGLYLFIRR